MQARCLFYVTGKGLYPYIFIRGTTVHSRLCYMHGEQPLKP